MVDMTIEAMITKTMAIASMGNMTTRAMTGTLQTEVTMTASIGSMTTWDMTGTMLREVATIASIGTMMTRCMIGIAPTEVMIEAIQAELMIIAALETTMTGA